MDYTKVKEKIKERIKINKETGCWEWQGGHLKKGYGVIGYCRKSYLVHRIIMNAQKGQQVNHHCDNPCCCNPKHLYIGTQSDNMRDKFTHGRGNQTGSNNARAKLDEHDVYGIKILLRNQEELKISQVEIAKMFNIIPRVISDINNNKTWKHVEL